jgi:hypothetical protein
MNVMIIYRDLHDRLQQNMNNLRDSKCFNKALIVGTVLAEMWGEINALYRTMQYSEFNSVRKLDVTDSAFGCSSMQFLIQYSGD